MKATRIFKMGIVAMAMACAGAVSFAQSRNLLVNGDAEDNVNGWQDFHDEWGTPSQMDFRQYWFSNKLRPYSGKFFWPSAHYDDGPYNPAALVQDIPASEYVGKKLTLSALVCGNDIAYVRIIAHGQTIAMLDEATSPDEVAGSNWREISTSLVVPPGTVDVSVWLYATKRVHDAELPMDVFFDNVTLTVAGTSYTTAGSVSSEDSFVKVPAGTF